MENGYGLIAQVLLCLGADRTKKSQLNTQQKFMPVHFDPHVWASLYQWAIQHYHPPFQLKLLNMLAHGQIKSALRIKNSNVKEITPLTQKLLPEAKPSNSISLNTWSIMLNGLIAYAQKYRLTGAQSLLDDYLAKIVRPQLPPAQFSVAEREMYYHLKHQTQDYTYINNAFAFFNVIDRLALEYDLVSIKFFLTQAQPEINDLFKHALKTDNRNLCTILMFIINHPQQNALTAFSKKIHHFLTPIVNIQTVKTTQPATILNLIIDTQLGSSQLIRAYCDKQSLLHLLQTTRASYQFQTTVVTDSYLLRSRFMAELQTSLNQQNFFSQRDWRFFQMLTLISLPLILIFSVFPTLLQKVQAIQTLNHVMHNITYALNSTKHCDDFSMDGNFPPNCLAVTSDTWANCNDSCQQLDTLASDFLCILTFGEILPTIFLGISLGIIHFKDLPSHFFKQFFSGEQRFDGVSLNQLQPTLKAQAEQLVQALNQEHFKGPFGPLGLKPNQQLSEAKLNTPDDITTVSSIRWSFNRTKDYYGKFFKVISTAPRIANDLVIDITPATDERSMILSSP